MKLRYVVFFISIIILINSALASSSSYDKHKFTRFLHEIEDVDIYMKNYLTEKSAKKIVPDIGIKDSKGKKKVKRLDIKKNPGKKIKKAKILSGYYDADLAVNQSPVETIEFKELVVSEDIEIGLEEVNVEGYVQSYAIDPTQLRFQNATVTAVAKGTELYKCKDWNFSAQACFGEWVLFKTGLIPGEEYTFMLTPDDPGFGESLPGIAYDNSSSAQGTGGVTFSHTVGSGENRLLVVSAGFEDSATGKTVTSVTYNGVEMAKINESEEGSGYSAYISLWYLNESSLPSTGAYDVIVSVSATPTRNVLAGAVSYENVAQQEPEDQCIGGSTVDTVSCSLTTSTDNAWIVSGVENGVTGDYSITGGTKRQEVDGGSSSSTFAVGDEIKATAGAESAEWTLTGTNRQAIVAAAFAPLSNSAPTHTTPILNSTSGTNTTDENLTAYNQSTSDPDGHVIKNIINWKRNNTPIAVLNMPFEGSSTSSYTKDYSGYGNDGTVSGAQFNVTGGYDGKGAYDFDGNDDYIGLPMDNIAAGKSEITLSLWIKPDEWISTNTIYDEWDNSNYWQFSVREDAWFTRDSSTGTQGTRNNDLDLPIVPEGEWHHLVFVYSVSQNLKAIYYDGQPFDSTNTSIDQLTSEREGARIGHASDGTNFDGSIDDVMIFNHSLSAEQISALYNNRTDLIVSQETKINETWQACITPNDGIADGTELCSNNIIIIAEAVEEAAIDMIVIEWIEKNENIIFNTEKEVLVVDQEEDSEVTWVDKIIDKIWTILT